MPSAAFLSAFESSHSTRCGAGREMHEIDEDEDAVVAMPLAVETTREEDATGGVCANDMSKAVVAT